MHHPRYHVQCRRTYPTRGSLAMLALICLAAAGRTSASEAPRSAPALELTSNVVARISDFDVPTDWFLHEFRSSFFRHASATNMRMAVFNPFLERMMLYALARQSGVQDDPAVQQRIQEKIGGMRAYMEYQLAMAEVGLVSDAYLESRGIRPTDIKVSDEELQAFFNEHIQGQPGAPENLADLPSALKDRVRRNLAGEKYGQLLSGKVAEWASNLEITVNQPVVDSMPMPEMERAPPEFPARPEP